MKKISESFLKKVTVLLLVLTVALIAVQLFISGNISAASQDLGLLEKKIKILEEENLRLETKSAFTSSLKVIQEKVDRLGFKNFLVLTDFTSEEPVALKFQ